MDFEGQFLAGFCSEPKAMDVSGAGDGPDQDRW
jgi:hypothetical protein